MDEGDEQMDEIVDPYDS